MTKRDVTSEIIQCRSCGAYFMVEVEGEGELCDLCCAAPASDLEDVALADTESVD